MGWIVISILLLVVVVVLRLKARGAAKSLVDTTYDRTPEDKQRHLESAGDTGDIVSWIIIGVLAFFWAIGTIYNSVHVVDAREVGVVRTFGSITGQVGEGLQLTWPWQSVETWNVRVQVIEPDTKCSNGSFKCMDAGSVDVQDVYVNGTLNIEVNPTDVQQLARNVGPSYVDTIVLNRLYQVVKEETARHRAADILGKREEIRNAIRNRMANEMRDYSITVIDFLITNIDFRSEFKQAIEDKVRAEQEALAEQNRVAIAEAQARQKAATAEGTANAIQIEARGQAEANRLINSSLTPELIQFQAVQKLMDNIQIALVPDNGSIIQLPAGLFERR